MKLAEFEREKVYLMLYKNFVHAADETQKKLDASSRVFKFPKDFAIVAISTFLEKIDDRWRIERPSALLETSWHENITCIELADTDIIFYIGKPKETQEYFKIAAHIKCQHYSNPYVQAVCEFTVVFAYEKASRKALYKVSEPAIYIYVFDNPKEYAAEGET